MGGQFTLSVLLWQTASLMVHDASRRSTWSAPPGAHLNRVYVVGRGSLNLRLCLTAESCCVQVLASSGGREGVMPYLEAFKTLIRCALARWRTTCHLAHRHNVEPTIALRMIPSASFVWRMAREARERCGELLRS